MADGAEPGVEAGRPVGDRNRNRNRDRSQDDIPSTRAEPSRITPVIRIVRGCVVTAVIRPFSSDLGALADEELMARVYEGDTRAFEVIFDRHAGIAFSLAYRMCGRRPLAEEIVQEAFMSLWRSTARYDPNRGSVRSWVLRVVHNRTIDAFRRELSSSSNDVSDEWISEALPARERTEDEVERRSDARLVRSALERLPADQRQVIELAYFGGFSHAQIAKALGLPAGTVKGRMRLGLNKLRIALGEPAGVLS
jgi:RNA polymerase sigma-70 factor (ECF subfamily)